MPAKFPHPPFLLILTPPEGTTVRIFPLRLVLYIRVCVCVCVCVVSVILYSLISGFYYHIFEIHLCCCGYQ